MRSAWYLGGACALAMLVLPTESRALPNEMAQEGLLLDAQGVALEGQHTLTVALYAAAAGGVPLFQEVHPNVELFEGYYTIAIGSISALTTTVIDRPTLYLGLRVDQGAELAPRTALRKVPAAFVADIAIDVTGDIHPKTVTVNRQVVINSDGEWVGPPGGLVGPAGPAGPAGAMGPPGPAGGDGSPDTPAQVRAKLVTVDGAGSGIDTDLFDGQDSTAFVRTPAEVLAKLVTVDGVGSGVDADRLDGLDSSQFVQTADQVVALLKTVDGAGSGVDADRLDGLDSTQFVRTGAEILALLTGVDGAGSGLDSDRLDGLDSTQFLRTGQDGLVAGLTVNGALDAAGGVVVQRAANDPVGCNAAVRGRIYFNTVTNLFMGCDGANWVALSGGGGGAGGRSIVIVNGARQWSDGTLARSCKGYRDDDDFVNPSDGLYRVNTGRGIINVYCDMNTAGGGWTVVGHYAHPGNVNAPADIANRDYAYFMRAQTYATYGNAAYIGDPNSAGPWTDWRPLEGMGWPAEFAVLLDVGFFTTRWENHGRKVIYQVKNRSVMPNWSTTQNLTSADNLLYKLNFGDAWSDVGTGSASGTYYWYPYSAGNANLSLFHVSNYFYLDGRAASDYHHGNYWGSGMGGDNSWHHASRLLMREINPAPAANETRILLGADGVRTWSDGSLSPTCKGYRNPPAGRTYIGDVGDGKYRIQTGVGPVVVFCDQSTDGGGWTMVGFYRNPGNVNGPADVGTRDYSYYMKARTDAAYGLPNYYADPDSAGPWTDWRVLSNMPFPAEYTIMLDYALPFTTGWEDYGRKVIYRVRSRDVLPNYGTSQDLLTGDNLYYKFTPGQAWTDVGGSSASGIYYWYPYTSGNAYLTLFHVSNYFYIDGRAATNYQYSNYWGSGLGGNNSWNHGSHQFMREL